jgi:hypothetical protein
LSKKPPLHTPGCLSSQPEDIANAVAFLAGTDGSWINGQVIKANGGIIWKAWINLREAKDFQESGRVVSRLLMT